MSTVQKAEAAMREALKTLFKQSLVQRVVIVDDHVDEKEPSVDSILDGIFESYESIKLQLYDIFPELEQFDDDVDVVTDYVKTKIELNVELKNQVVAVVASNKSLVKDSVFYTKIFELLEPLESGDVIELERFGDYRSVEPCENTLYLIDKFFGESPSQMGSPQGVQLIENILRAQLKNSYCALVTNSVQPHEERNTAKELKAELDERHSQGSSYPLERFTVISKERLIADNTHSQMNELFHLIKLTVLGPLFAALKDATTSVLQSSTEYLIGTTSDWSSFDFNEVVFAIPRREGDWEGNTCFRVMISQYLKASKEVLLGNDDIRSIIVNARAVSAITYKDNMTNGDRKKVRLKPLSWSGLGEDALQYQKNELYYESNEINKYHLPLCMGDVFEITYVCPNTKKDVEANYMLLSQDCDLMVRSNGVRSRDKNYSQMATLVCIKEAKPERAMHYELPFWTADGQSNYIEFPQSISIRTCMLDLCVFNKDGSAKWFKDSSHRTDFFSVWQERYDGLSSFFEGEILRYNSLAQVLAQSDYSDNEVLARTLPFCSLSDKVSVSIETNESIRLNIRRIRRLVTDRAKDVLLSYSRYKSRTAFEQFVVNDSILDQIQYNQEKLSNAHP